VSCPFSEGFLEQSTAEAESDDASEVRLGEVYAMDEWLQLELGAMIRCCLFPHFPTIFRPLAIRLASNDLHHVGAYNLMNEAVLMVSTAKVCLITTYKVQQFR